jgi:gas vesicle protein
MEDKNNNNQNSGSGFLLGLVIGSVTTLLFTTKKGRELVKEMTDSALDKFSELQEGLDEAVDIEELEGDDYIEREERPSQKEEEPKLLAVEKASETEGESKATHPPVKATKSVKRFFKKKT